MPNSQLVVIKQAEDRANAFRVAGANHRAAVDKATGFVVDNTKATACAALSYFAGFITKRAQ